jgi:hypothetical protein
MNIGKQILLTLVLLCLAVFSLSSIFQIDKDDPQFAPLEKPMDPWITEVIPAEVQSTPFWKSSVYLDRRSV